MTPRPRSERRLKKAVYFFRLQVKPLLKGVDWLYIFINSISRSQRLCQWKEYIGNSFLRTGGTRSPRETSLVVVMNKFTIYQAGDVKDAPYSENATFLVAYKLPTDYFEWSATWLTFLPYQIRYFSGDSHKFPLIASLLRHLYWFIGF